MHDSALLDMLIFNLTEMQWSYVFDINYFVPVSTLSMDILSNVWGCVAFTMKF